MNRARTRLGALPMMCAAALMLAACQGAEPEPAESQSADRFQSRIQPNAKHRKPGCAKLGGARAEPGA